MTDEEVGPDLDGVDHLFADEHDSDEQDSEEQDFDGQAFDDEVELVGRSRRLIVAFGLALAALVFIGIAGATLIAVLIFRIRDHTDPNHTVRQQYTARYASCVRSGGDKYGCGVTVLQACEKDSWWRNPARTEQRETVCLATVPDATQ